MLPDREQAQDHNKYNHQHINNINRLNLRNMVNKHNNNQNHHQQEIVNTIGDNYDLILIFLIIKYLYILLKDMNIYTIN